jgi:hypothetical protein
MKQSPVTIEFEATKESINADKLIKQLFIGKVVEEIGYEKTNKLLGEAVDAINGTIPLYRKS